MKKITLGIVLIVLASGLTLSAQIMKPSVTINRDKASIIQHLPSNVRLLIAQIRVPQSDSKIRI